MRTAGLILAVLLLSVLTFVLLGDGIEPMIADFVRVDRQLEVKAAAIFGLLAADIFLPVPSSLVSFTAGAALGPVLGAMVSAAGMTAGSLLGYWFGSAFSSRASKIVSAEAGSMRLEAWLRDQGLWVVAATRGIPMIAETSAIASGLLRLDLLRFSIVSALANFAVSVVYCLLGSSGETPLQFAMALLASVMLPAALLLIWSRKMRLHSRRDAAIGRSATKQ